MIDKIDCFAYKLINKKDGNVKTECKALTTKTCNKCKFYKTRESLENNKLK